MKPNKQIELLTREDVVAILDAAISSSKVTRVLKQYGYRPGEIYEEGGYRKRVVKFKNHDFVGEEMSIIVTEKKPSGLSGSNNFRGLSDGEYIDDLHFETPEVRSQLINKYADLVMQRQEGCKNSQEKIISEVGKVKQIMPEMIDFILRVSDKNNNPRYGKAKLSQEAIKVAGKVVNKYGLQAEMGDFIDKEHMISSQYVGKYGIELTSVYISSIEAGSRVDGLYRRLLIDIIARAATSPCWDDKSKLFLLKNLNNFDLEGDKELLDVLRLEYLTPKTELIFEHKKEIEKILKKWGVSVDERPEAILVDESKQCDGYFYTGVFKRSFFFEKEEDTKEGRARAEEMIRAQPIIIWALSNFTQEVGGYDWDLLKMTNKSSPVTFLEKFSPLTDNKFQVVVSSSKARDAVKEVLALMEKHYCAMSDYVNGIINDVNDDGYWATKSKQEKITSGLISFLQTCNAKDKIVKSVDGNATIAEAKKMKL